MLATENTKAIVVECGEPSFLMSPPSERLPVLSHPPVWGGGHQPWFRCHVSWSSRALVRMILYAIANAVVTFVAMSLHLTMITVGLHASVFTVVYCICSGG